MLIRKLGSSLHSLHNLFGRTATLPALAHTSTGMGWTRPKPCPPWPAKRKPSVVDLVDLDLPTGALPVIMLREAILPGSKFGGMRFRGAAAVASCRATLQGGPSWALMVQAAPHPDPSGRIGVLVSIEGGHIKGGEAELRFTGIERVRLRTIQRTGHTLRASFDVLSWRVPCDDSSVVAFDQVVGTWNTPCAIDQEWNRIQTAARMCLSTEDPQHLLEHGYRSVLRGLVKVRTRRPQPIDVASA